MSDLTIAVLANFPSWDRIARELTWDKGLLKSLISRWDELDAETPEDERELTFRDLVSEAVDKIEADPETDGFTFLAAALASIYGLTTLRRNSILAQLRDGPEQRFQITLNIRPADEPGRPSIREFYFGVPEEGLYHRRPISRKASDPTDRAVRHPQSLKKAMARRA